MPLFFVIVLQPCEPGAGDAAEHGEDQEEEGRGDRQGGREQQIVLACFQLPCRLKAFANCVLIMYMSQKYRFFLSWLLLINTFFLYEELGKS